MPRSVRPAGTAPGTRVASPRQHNRRDVMLAAAAKLIAGRGYDAVSMRDIARAAGMQPGSIYYHYASKDELFVAVHGEAVAAIAAAVETAIRDLHDPWARLEAAAGAHLEALLGTRRTARIVSPDFPIANARIRKRLVAQRDGYERRFSALIDAVPLARDEDRTLVRLMLLGALNWAPRWYRPGRLPPGEIGRRFVRMLHPARGDRPGGRITTP